MRAVGRLVVGLGTVLVPVANGQSVGSVSLGAVVGARVQGPVQEAVFGGHGSFGFESGRWFLGPEYSVTHGAATRTWAVGLVARVSWPGERIRPFLVAGAGSYQWSSRYAYQVPSGQTVTDWARLGYFSGSIGAGVELGAARSRLSPRLEARYHTNLQRSDIGAGGLGLVTAAAGLRYRW